MSSEGEEVEMDAAAVEEGESSSRAASFQLQLEKPIPSQVKIAEWNPEKDLLAMVTEDSKIMLHRFNWQRLWMISPGRCITSLCWRPDGKAVAVGLEDGSISLYDVEHGRLLRNIKPHNNAVICLHWEEDTQRLEVEGNKPSNYEDRALRFFPPPPRIPRTAGLTSGDTGNTEEPDDTVYELLSISPCCQFNILCSGDMDGDICFSIFGIFPIGKMNILNFAAYPPPYGESQATYSLKNACMKKVYMSKNLCQLVILCTGGLVEDLLESEHTTCEQEESYNSMKVNLANSEDSVNGFHLIHVDTSIFHNRKNELHQVAQQASSIEDLIEVVRVSVSIMHKQWSDAIQMFHEKFESLASLITDHGLDSNPQDEFLSFFLGIHPSPPLQQFLVNSLGEAGLRRVSNSINSAGKELHMIIREHLQPAVEMIGFRVGELRGLSRWHARFQGIGLDETLIDDVMEKAGMVLVQLERFLRVLATVIYQFQNFFNWLTKCIRLLMSEPTDQIPLANSENVIIFLKFHYKYDFVAQFLDIHQGESIKVDLETINRVEELVAFGGFTDSEFLSRNLAKELENFEKSYKEALSMPFTTVSKKICCEGLVPLFPTTSSLEIIASVSDYMENLSAPNLNWTARHRHYICFRVPHEIVGLPNSICIARDYSRPREADESALEAVVLTVPDGYYCVDLSLYKERNLIVILNETTINSETPGRSWMMLLETDGLPFSPISKSAQSNSWMLHTLKDSALGIDMEIQRMRCIPQLVTTPLAVSASRGVACVFTSRKRALVYILDEDEDEASDME